MRCTDFLFFLNLSNLKIEFILNGSARIRSDPLECWASKAKLFELTAVNFLISIVHVIFPSIMVLYLSYRYGWSVGTVGYMLAAVGLTNGIVQGAMVAPAVKKVW